MKKTVVFSDHKWLSIEDETAKIYNDWDVYSTAIVYKNLVQELKDNRQYDYFQTYVWPLINPIRKLQKHGLYLSLSALQEHQERIGNEIYDLNQTILSFCPDGPINIDSNEQLADLLYVKLKLRCHKYTESGSPSVDQEALYSCHSHLLKRQEKFRPLLESLFHRSKLKTIQERYLSVKPDVDNRVRPRIKFPGTETGRLAYADPPEQQRPEMVRNIFCSAPGYIFIGADYSQLEARIMSILSGDTASLAVFKAGEDIHDANAMDLFAMDLASYKALEPRQRKGYRDFAKGFLYRLMYGGSAEHSKQRIFCPCPKCQFYNNMNLTRKEIKEADVRWMMKHPQVSKWRRQLVYQVKNNGWYTDPFGGRRCFMAPMSEIERELYNYPMQKTAADIVNGAMILGHQKYDMPFFMQMHDFLGVEVPYTEKDLWIERLKEVMERPIPELDNAIFPVEMKIGPNWRDMKKVK